MGVFAGTFFWWQVIWNFFIPLKLGYELWVRESHLGSILTSRKSHTPGGAKKACDSFWCVIKALLIKLMWHLDHFHFQDGCSIAMEEILKIGVKWEKLLKMFFCTLGRFSSGAFLVMCVAGCVNFSVSLSVCLSVSRAEVIWETGERYGVRARVFGGIWWEVQWDLNIARLLSHLVDMQCCGRSRSSISLVTKIVRGRYINSYPSGDSYL